MPALISGSFAFDNIMVFKGRFRDNILPDQIDNLNVAFNVDDLRREFGGCAGNIAYTLKLLGGSPVPMGTVGSDFGPYAEWMDRHEIPRDHVKEIGDSYTAQAYITTDLDDNQITAFHPGAMSQSHQVNLGDTRGLALGIISPDGRDGMMQHAAQLAAAGIPFIFDPGQAIGLFDGDDLLSFTRQATWMTVNEYESHVVQEKTGRSVQDLLEDLQAVLVTLGKQGSMIYTREDTLEVPIAQPSRVVDPTGCGDAYRAGVLYGLENGLGWEATGRIAALAGAYNVEQAGTQKHHFSRADFDRRLGSAFGFSLE